MDAGSHQHGLVLDQKVQGVATLTFNGYAVLRVFGVDVGEILYYLSERGWAERMRMNLAQNPSPLMYRVCICFCSLSKMGLYPHFLVEDHCS